MITQEQTRKTVQAHRVHAKDTGSSDVQVALLTDRILYLSEHLKLHPKDHHSRRGLLQMVSHRSSLLRYLSRTEPKRHAGLLDKLGIRK